MTAPSSRPRQRAASAPQWSMAEWLAYIESIERGRGIRLGLERIRRAWRRLGAHRPAERIVCVAGTNGKGSVVHLLHEALLAHGLRAGRYTSPHLRRFNERIALVGREASDAECIEAFAEVYGRCHDIGLSYFEFVTLAALLIMSEERLEVAVLEVGLGGRYDAVNLIDADIAIITSIGLDHCQYLGSDLGGIAREKCGIMRAGKPVLCAMLDHQRHAAALEAIVEEAESLGARLRLGGRDWQPRLEPDGSWIHCRDGAGLALPVPPACGAAGIDNAAVAVEALSLLLGPALAPQRLAAVCAGLSLPGRFQRGRRHPHILFDSAHNAPALERLLDRLRDERLELGCVVFGARLDKDIDEMLALFGDRPRDWLAVDFGEGLHPPERIAESLRGLMKAGRMPEAPVHQPGSAMRAAARLMDKPSGESAVHLVCGSFKALEDMLDALGEPGEGAPAATFPQGVENPT